MKTFRKNLDLTSDTVAILQIEATLSQFGTLKPFLESLLEAHAAKCRKARPKVYEAIIEKKVMKMTTAARKKSGR
ncbi:MAG TPA: hypothetical protein VGQ59_01590 [Cyclobacteriaceae bacterium]|jgi:hypothetical protein|nr:hypothetical protein [Cyclobacteriaceae bacterium]